MSTWWKKDVGPFTKHNTLDFGLPESFTIYTGDCPSRRDGDSAHDQTKAMSWNGFAHLHNCEKDPYYLTICIEYENHLKNEDDGSPSDILLHEYAHAVDAVAHKGFFTSIKCHSALKHEYEISTNKTVSSIIEKYMKNDFHGPTWERFMRAMGLEPSRWVSPPRKAKTE